MGSRPKTPSQSQKVGNFEAIVRTLICIVLLEYYLGFISQINNSKTLENTQKAFILY